MKRIVILGGGFAGVWAALSARRLAEARGSKGLEIILISNSLTLGIRPRFYEDNIENAKVELSAIFEGLDIKVLMETVRDLDMSRRVVQTDKTEHTFDGLVYALGSRIIKPNFAPGAPLFFVDSLGEGRAFENFLKSTDRTDKLKIGVAGAGFTGLEAVMEIPKRLRSIGVSESEVFLIERGDNVAPEFGSDARKKIESALGSERIVIKTGVSIQSFDEAGAVLSNGEKLSLDALIWTAGVKPPKFSHKISSAIDSTGRLLVNNFLQTPDTELVWAAGDVAAPLTDGKHRSAMSCQHAIPQGRIAGYNAAATLLGLPQMSYQQILYVTCLDLGDWGALLTVGWDRNKILAYGQDAKRVKRMVNQKAIYPPLGSKKKRLKAGTPEHDSKFKARALEFALSNRFLRNLATPLA